MKMAKASKADLEAAQAVCRLVEALQDGQLPDEMTDGEDVVWYEDKKHAADVIEHLKKVVGSASLFRVCFGMLVLLDPTNEIVDPESSVLDLHPKHGQAQKRIASLEADNKAAWATNRVIDKACQNEMRRRDDLSAALVKAEAFIAGFEGDELQEGIDELLSEIRAAITGGSRDTPQLNVMAAVQKGD